MSHSSSSSVIENNTTIIINMANKGSESGKLPIKPIPAGTPAAAVEKELQKGLLDAVSAEWKAAFPNTPQSANFEFAFFEGPAQLSIDMPVPNAIKAIDTDLNNWGLVTSSGFAASIVQTMLLRIIMEGGIVATSHGSQTVGPVQTTDWACATVTGQAGSGDQIVHLIGYVFTATQA